MLLVLLNEIKQFNLLLLHLKSSENHRFFMISVGKRSYLIRLNSLNIRSEIWGQSLRTNNIEDMFCLWKIVLTCSMISVNHKKVN